ncbi:GntR family transcriptional regulator [Pseudactinotalea terrae]|uniref:GntR family transcriptional regulator n=1 Tax=Pseudactinotalea terrae TaxID=1743262 RepID=UPI0019D60351|nr:GntR family transcriptional regulator [Pseudactinotalea terrae]
MDVIKPLAPRRVLGDEVHATLTALIMDHTIAPDTRLNIEALARDLGVSPTPVREALARLESDGLVAKEPLRGYRTTAVLTPGELAQVFEFRRLVEPWAAAQAAERRTADDVIALRAELASAPAATTGSDYAHYAALAQHDQRFHTMLLRLAGNDVALAAFERTRAHLHQFRYAFSASMTACALTEHRAIVDAIEAGDSRAAQAAMTAHLTAAHDRITASAET